MGVDLSANLYRQNAFRILGLPSDATYRKVTQHARRLTTALESRDSEVISRMVVGGFGGAPDEPSVRDAASQLGDPRKRLLNELFWFRSCDDNDGAGKFFRDARPSIVAEALDIWREAEEFGTGPEAATATHNLAVFHHLLALEFEAELEADFKRKDFDLARRRALRDATNYCWSHALARWRALLADASTWEWARLRADAIGKGRLPLSEVGAIEKGASAALLVQTAQFLLRCAERDQEADISSLRDVALQAGFSRGEIDGATRTVLEPRQQRIHRGITNVKDNLNSGKPSLGRLTLEMLDKAEADLALFYRLLGKDDQIVVELCDAVCHAANLGQVAHWKHTKDDAFAFSVLGRLVKLVRSPQLRKTIEGNLSVFECFFCPADDKSMAKDSYAYEVKLWKIDNINTRTGNYRQQGQTIKVPRCGKCAAARRSARVAEHPAVASELSAGWRFGSSPSREDLQQAFALQGRMMPLSSFRNN
jgi:hypothetical protein